MEPNLNDESPVALTKKAWNDGPHLVLISHNTVSGGGPLVSAKEITGTYLGQPHAVLFTTGQKGGVGNAMYNSFHS